ncbi:MAG: aminotransferase class III-fold pyridoxal phosphate-dependent enzyme, partial [Chloroflexi bacterium]|nr:aminotransferase class III-fold pyridoxal phosphate-dependent enzyme [Chloroflexota bacterium]
AAFGGKKEVMMSVAPGKVFQGGTYTGNVVSTAAADATLEFIQSGKVFSQINKVGGIIMAGIGEILNRYSIPHFINGTPAMFGIVYTDTQPRDWRDLHNADWDLYETITDHMVENGVMPDSDGFEPYFLCVDHTEEDAAETLQAFENGLKHALSKK